MKQIFLCPKKVSLAKQAVGQNKKKRRVYLQVQFLIELGPLCECFRFVNPNKPPNQRALLVDLEVTIEPAAPYRGFL